MVSTLRIAGVVAVVLAGLLLASVTGFASIKTLNAEKDEELARVISAPSVVERFQERQGDLEQSRQEAINPLVKEAEILSTILNPPAPVAPPVQVTNNSGRQRRDIPQPPRPAAKFDLVGTSFSEAGQADCLAYIKMRDGKTSKWVQVGDEIGHLTIRQIKRDSIVCWDGGKEVALFVPQRINQADFLEGGTSATTAASIGVYPSANERITGTSTSNPAAGSAAAYRPTPVPGANPLAPRPGQQQTDSVDRLAATISHLKQAAEGSPVNPEDREALMQQMREFSAARARRAQEEEANSRASSRPGSVPVRRGPNGVRSLNPSSR